MKTIIGFLFCLVAWAGLGADVNETNIPVATYLAPTDYVRVLTNGAAGLANAKTRIAPISLLPSAGGAQVFTNDGVYIYPLMNSTSNIWIDLVPGSSIYPTNRLYWRATVPDLSSFNLEIVATGTRSLQGFRVELADAFNQNGQGYSGRTPWAIYAVNSVTNKDNAGWLYGGDASISVVGDAFQFTPSGGSIGVYGWAESLALIQSGVAGFAVGGANSVTNVGVSASSSSGGFLGNILTGLYSEISFDSFPANPNITNAVILADSRETGYPLFVGRTNNGDTVFRVESSGVVIANGTLYASNAVPVIPTAAELGMGGHQTMNSNGFLVDIYTLDGATTVMKVLAP